MVRVRQLLPGVKFSALESLGLLPAIDARTFDSGCKQHAKWVYTYSKTYPNIFSYMGFFYEYLCRKMMCDFTPFFTCEDPLASKIGEMMDRDPVTAAMHVHTLASISDPKVKWQDLVYPIFQLVGLYFEGSIPVSKAEVHSSFAKYTMIYKFLQSSFRQAGTVAFNTELSHRSLTGHPDIFMPHCIVDVKAVQSFKTTAEECMLQVYSYVALARAQGHPVNYVGILLPLHCKMLMYDVTAWDSTKFLEFICDRSDHMSLCSLRQEEDAALFQQEMQQYDIRHGTIAGGHRCGHHIAKAGMTFHQSIMAFFNERPTQPRNVRPCQIFVANPQGGGDVTFNQAEVDQARALVEESNLKLFVHLSYLINLSRMITGEKTGKTRPEFVWNRLSTEIHISKSLGAQGCVIHTGQPVDKPVPEALDFMEMTIRWCLPQVTEYCPLILETPAERTELCNSLEMLSAFYNRFTAEEKKLLKICVDTCHIFASGHHPCHYISTWLDLHPGSIVLVHYNDSRQPSGSFKDEHHAPGHGHIGYPTMQRVAALCTKHNIPMVIE